MSKSGVEAYIYLDFEFIENVGRILITPLDGRM